MGVESKVPAIRFLGFSGEWVSSELGKLLDITSAARVHKNEWTDVGVPFFRTSDVVSIYKGQENKKAYISLELYKELSARTGSVKKDDLLITGGGSIGIPYLITTSDPIYFKDADLLWLKNTTGTNGYLLFTFFSSPPFRKYINSITHIGTISHYTIEQAKTTPIHVSEESEEQTKIGNYFKQLDTLIAQHQKKHDKLLNLKKALLEKMFPKQGSTVPEIRFKGFSGEWVEKNLVDVSNKVTEKNESFEFTETLTNSAEFGVISQSDYFDKKISNSENINGYYVVRNDNFVYNPRISSFAPVGPVNRNKLKRTGVMSPLYTVFSTCDIDNSFLEYFFNSKYWHGYMFLHGDTGARSDRFSIKDATFFKMPIPYPKEKNEQTKIGNLFKQVDTLITQHQAQLKKLNNIKQACLEKMFV